MEYLIITRCRSHVNRLIIYMRNMMMLLYVCLFVMVCVCSSDNTTILKILGRKWEQSYIRIILDGRNRSRFMNKYRTIGVNLNNTIY